MYLVFPPNTSRTPCLAPCTSCMLLQCVCRGVCDAVWKVVFLQDFLQKKILWEIKGKLRQQQDAITIGKTLWKVAFWKKKKNCPSFKVLLQPGPFFEGQWAGAAPLMTTRFTHCSTDHLRTRPQTRHWHTDHRKWCQTSGQRRQSEACSKPS